MAFPSVVNSNTATSSGTTTHNLAMPSGLVAGNLLIACVAVNLGVTNETVTGWTKYVEAARGDTTTTLWIYGRVATADGDDQGTFTAGVAGNWASVVYQIQNWSGSLGSITATSTTSANDPPSLSVTTADSYLWLAGLGAESSVTAAPSGFSGLVTATSSSTRASLAWLQANASSEDPGAFSGGSTSAASCTVGIPPSTSFPVVVNSATSSGAPSGVSTQTPTLPADIVSGNLLLWIVGTNSNGGVNTPTGYTKLGEVDNGVGNSSSLAAYARVATGSDSSSFAGFSGLQWAAIVYQISGWDGTVGDCTWAGSTGALDPPALTPGFGAGNYLWLALGVNWTNSITAAPTSYTNLITKSTSSTIKLGAAQRALNASGEDPGTFGGTASFPQAATVAIKPAVTNVTLSRSITDTVTGTDACASHAAYFRTVSDAAPVSELVTRRLGKSVSDSVSATEARTRHASYFRTVSDAASAVDVATRGIATNQRRSISETLAARESATSHRSFYLATATVTESAPASDQGTEVTGRLPAPLLKLSALVGDTGNVIAIALNKLMTFPAGTSPSANTGTNVVRAASISESIGSTGDTVTSFTDQKLNDTAAASDAASFAYIRRVSETVRAVDVATAPVYLRDVFDATASTTDSLSANISYRANTSDAAFGRLLSGENQLDVAVAS